MAIDFGIQPIWEWLVLYCLGKVWILHQYRQTDAKIVIMKNKNHCFVFWRTKMGEIEHTVQCLSSNFVSFVELRCPVCIPQTSKSEIKYAQMRTKINLWLFQSKSYRNWAGRFLCKDFNRTYNHCPDEKY